MLDNFAPTLRKEVLDSEEFRTAFKLNFKATIQLNPNGPTFDRKTLFDAIRSLLAGSNATSEVAAIGGARWAISRTSHDSDEVLVQGEGGTFALSGLACLSSDQATRLAWLSSEAKRANVNDAYIKQWQDRLAQRTLDDEEVDLLLSEFRATPEFVANSIADQLKGDELDLEQLVPSDIRYFQRLVGAPPLAEGLLEYSQNSASAFIAQLLQWHPVEGAKRALLMSSHPWLVSAIALHELPKSEMIMLYESLAQAGDRISQLGAIECGLSLLETVPELEPRLCKLIQQFIDDDPDDPASRLSQTSGLIVLVESELARTAVMGKCAPFWRRMAAIAHASVIERAVIARGMPLEFFYNLARRYARYYYLQSFVDLRREPRWHPDFVMPRQLKAEFAGRIAAAATAYDKRVQTPELRALLFDETPTSIRGHLSMPFSWLPGPLEGGVTAVVDMPTDFEADVRKALEDENLSAKSFVGLVNSSLIFRLSPQVAGWAAEGLKRVRYQVRGLKDSGDMFYLLTGLATVAAVLRSSELAEQVRILVRVVRRRPEVDIDVSDAVRIALMAAAAETEFDKWASFVGDWLTELAFEEMVPEKAILLKTHIRILCCIEPRLWEACGRADVACEAFIDLPAA